MSSAMWILVLILFHVESSLSSLLPKTVSHHIQCLPYNIDLKVTTVESLLKVPCKIDCFRTGKGICQPCQQCGHNEVIIRKCTEQADAQCGGLISQTKEMPNSLGTIPVPASSIKLRHYLDPVKFSMLRRRKRQSFEDKKNNSTIPPNAKQENIPAESSGGVSTWVFIAIGVSVLVVAVMIFLAAIMYRRKKKGRRSKSSNSQAKTSENIYGSGDNVELEELETLNKIGDYSDKNDGTQNISIPRVRLINATNNSHAEGTPFLLRSCVSGSEEPDEFGGRSRGLFSQCGDSENKLRGGNGDYHRQYVDMNYVKNDLEPNSVERGQKELFYIRNESKRNDRHYSDRFSGDCELDRRVYGRKTADHHVQRKHVQSARISSTTSSDSLYHDNQSRNKRINSQHSTRRYLRIPPTLPSENYIEVGLDNVSICSEMPSKMEWLTKKTDFLPKNELGNYQSTSGTQTDCGASTPRCRTVFDTPWQFGGTFTSKGGVLQAKNSDVRLNVGANSIPKGDYVDIFGAIFTDTPEIRKKFKFSAEESLMSPVVEYHREPDGEFQKALCLKLPHSLTEDFDVSMVKVYTFYRNDRGKVILYTLPMKQKVNLEADGYWEKSQDGATIDISTKHFSGYFCTTCSNTSLPSICSMVFGSHVQINSSRREVRVTLYIWDRRLTIKDYLERIRKQESDVDRQLLTDMQIPLIDEASSDSRVVMRMEVLGDPGERSCWKHICRADGSSPLFKPLQARRLYDIVHCCRQTDPIRVEWALENVPHQVPGSIFQCCIDIMHVPRDIRDYETAMREDSDDLMRTFYVRDLKVIPNPTQTISSMTKVDLKRTIAEVLDESQTEQICFELGITEKDIGNFKRKFTSSVKLQEGLVEECLHRHGMDNFLKVLPEILAKLKLGHALRELKSRDLFSTASEHVKTPQQPEQRLEDRPTDCKHSHADTHCKVSAFRLHSQAQQMAVLQKQESDDSNDTVFHDNYQVGQNSLGREEMKVYSAAAQPAEIRNPRFDIADDICKKGSSSGSDSVLRSGSILSSDSTNHSTLQSLDEFSVTPQVGTLPYINDDTKKKEIAVMGQSAQAYPDLVERWPDRGPSGIYPRKSGPSFISKPQNTLVKKSERRLPLEEIEETKKKELYDVHTVV